MLIQREQLIEQLSDTEQLWDIVVIGGGATGLGVALDAAARGYKTLLLERADFAKGTSSRSTKLVHGGVRYLAQGNIRLVREALYERGLLLKNAAHLVKNLSFIIPNYSWFDRAFYSIGLVLYDLLSGRRSFGHSQHLTGTDTAKRLPGILVKGLRGGILYHDGQFDDARLAINLAQTCLEHNGLVLNYFGVNGLLKHDGKTCGVMARDEETGIVYRIRSKAVVNATGVFADDILQLDEPSKKPTVKPSQGIHIVVDRSFMPGTDAMLIPKTADGRVLFMVPWYDKLLIGTTDTPLNETRIEPRALEEEITFVIDTANAYLQKPISPHDVASIFAGLRPLAIPGGKLSATKEISRGHKILVSQSGLVTITGGKWTTYRRMAEDTVDQVIKTVELSPAECVTRNLPVHGNIAKRQDDTHWHVYGSDREALLELINENPEWAEKLHLSMEYTKAEVIWAARHEMARTVEDVLARRMRMLFLDASAAIEAAPEVARILASELIKDAAWVKNQEDDFVALAKGYLLT